MSSDQRPVPSRMMLQALKIRRKGAHQGYTLLKKKSDALTARFRGMLKEIVQTKREMGEELREAAFALAKATYAAGEFKDQVIEHVRRPGVTLKLSSDNVAGVKLPVFTLNHDPSVDVMGNIGISIGGQVIAAARDRYLKALTALVKLASLQVVIPKIDYGVNYITKELDEMEREEFFRLKKIQEKKRQRAEVERLEALAKGHSGGDGAPAGSLLDDRDEDIIF